MSTSDTAWSRSTKYTVGICLALLGIYLLWLTRSVLPSLVLAALIAVIVRPAIVWLHVRVGVPRGPAVAIVYLLVLILVPVAMALAVPATINAVRYVARLDYPALVVRFGEWMRSTLFEIKAAQLLVPQIDLYVDQTIDALLLELQRAGSGPVLDLPPAETIVRSLGVAVTATLDAIAGVVGSVVSRVALLTFTFLASIYISLGAHTYRRAFLELVAPAHRSEIDTLLERVGRVWTAYFRGQLTLMLAIGLMTWVGLTVLGAPGALYLGIVAGLLELIPNLGPVIAAVPAVVVALLQGSNHLPVGNLAFAGIVIAFYILVQQIENNLVVPRVLGQAVDLPALVVMTGVLVGASIAGILGALLATPVIATGREILRYVLRKMQGEAPFPPDEPQAAPPSRSPRPRRRLSRWIWRKR